ncbi:MAG: DUF6318 family protein [Dermabacter sp.]|nr:DUF6318 family protein [Dermabacter sp.]
MPPENEGILPPDRANYPGIDTETDEGAEQTVKFFFDAMYYGYATGDTVPIENVASENCTQCIVAIKDIRRRTQVDGTFLVGHNSEPLEIHVSAPESDQRTTIYYAYKEGAAAGISQDGGQQVFLERKMHSATDLAFIEGRWSVVDIAWEENLQE